MIKKIFLLIFFIFILSCGGANKDFVSKDDLKLSIGECLENDNQNSFTELDLEKITNLNAEEYLDYYYDLAIAEQSKPYGFFLPKNLACEIFKNLVKEHYGVSFTVEEIIIEEHREYYVITGTRYDEKIYFDNLKIISVIAITLIMRISDGAIITLFVQK